MDLWAIGISDFILCLTKSTQMSFDLLKVQKPRHMEHGNEKIKKSEENEIMQWVVKPILQKNYTESHTEVFLKLKPHTYIAVASYTHQSMVKMSTVEHYNVMNIVMMCWERLWMNAIYNVCPPSGIKSMKVELIWGRTSKEANKIIIMTCLQNI